MKQQLTRNALEILDALHPPSEKDRRYMATLEIRGDIQQLVYDAREAAGLTQLELARKAGLKKSEILDIEQGDYDGDYVQALASIGHALGFKFTVAMEPAIKVETQHSKPTSRRKSA